MIDPQPNQDADDYYQPSRVSHKNEASGVIIQYYEDDLKIPQLIKRPKVSLSKKKLSIKHTTTNNNGEYTIEPSVLTQPRYSNISQKLHS